MNENYKERLKEAAAFVENQYGPLGYTVFFIALNGSQNYELDSHTDTYESDYDYCCVVIPSLRRLISHPEYLSKTIDYQGGHINVKDIRKFARELRKQDPSTLEVLFTKNKLDRWAVSALEALEIITKEMLEENPAPLIHSAYGTCTGRMKKVFVPTPSTEEVIEQDGYDGKSAYQAFRMYCILDDLYEGRGFRLVHGMLFQDIMRKLKQQEYPDHIVRDMLDSMKDDLEENIMPYLWNKYEASEPQEYDRICSFADEIVYSHCLD